MTMVSQASAVIATESTSRSPGYKPTLRLENDGGKPRMVRLTVNLPSDLVEQVRNAVYWTPGLTVAWMVAQALRISLAELESVREGPFPKRAKPLRAGRPRLAGQSMKVQPPPRVNGNKSSSERSLQARIGMAPQGE
ncbi:MAG TPA: hypothetical protein VIR79_03350 [Nitrospira sp.]